MSNDEKPWIKLRNRGRVSVTPVFDMIVLAIYYRQVYLPSTNRGGISVNVHMI